MLLIHQMEVALPVVNIRPTVPIIAIIMIHQIIIKTHLAMTHHTKILHENPLMTI